MILVDSSVWIDFFRGSATPQAEILDALIDNQLLTIGDLILAEVLQGFPDERSAREATVLLSQLELVELCGREIAVKAARNFRTLRARGITVRKTIDCIIATFCIENGCQLLHNDRDFVPYVKHLGLQVVS